MGGLIRRLFIAGILIGLTALACWKLAPRMGLDVPWWVPITCFIVILAATLGTTGREESDPDVPETSAPDPDAPIPFRPPTDDGGPEGISAADRERFG